MTQYIIYEVYRGLAPLVRKDPNAAKPPVFDSIQKAFFAMSAAALQEEQAIKNIKTIDRKYGSPGFKVMAFDDNETPANFNIMQNHNIRSLNAREALTLQELFNNEGTAISTPPQAKRGGRPRMMTPG